MLSPAAAAPARRGAAALLVAARAAPPASRLPLVAVVSAHVHQAASTPSPSARRAAPDDGTRRRRPDPRGSAAGKQSTPPPSQRRLEEPPPTLESLLSRWRKADRLRGVALTLPLAQEALQHAVERGHLDLARSVLEAVSATAKARLLRPPPDDPDMAAAAARSPTGTLARPPKRLFLDAAEGFARRGRTDAVVAVLRAMTDVRHALEPVDLAPLMEAVQRALRWVRSPPPAGVEDGGAGEGEGDTAAGAHDERQLLAVFDRYLAEPPGVAAAAAQRSAWDAAVTAVGAPPQRAAALTLSPGGRVELVPEPAPPSGGAPPPPPPRRRLATYADLDRDRVRGALSPDCIAWVSQQLLLGATHTVRRAMERAGTVREFHDRLAAARAAEAPPVSGRQGQGQPPRRASQQAGRGGGGEHAGAEAEAVPFWDFHRAELAAMRADRSEMREFLQARGLPVGAVDGAFSACDAAGLAAQGAQLVAAVAPFLRVPLGRGRAFWLAHRLVSARQPAAAVRLLQAAGGQWEVGRAGGPPAYLFPPLVGALGQLPGREALAVVVTAAGQHTERALLQQQQHLLQRSGDGGDAAEAGVSQQPAPSADDDPPPPPSSGVIGTTTYISMLRLCMDTVWLEGGLRRAAAARGGDPADPRLTWRGGVEGHPSLAPVDGAGWPHRPPLAQRRKVTSPPAGAADGGWRNARGRGGGVEVVRAYDDSEGDDDDGAVGGPDAGRVPAGASSDSDAAPPAGGGDSDGARAGRGGEGDDNEVDGDGNGDDDGDDDVDPLYRAFALLDSREAAWGGSLSYASELGLNVAFVTGALRPSADAAAAWAARQGGGEGAAPRPRPLVHIALEALRRVCVVGFVRRRTPPGAGSDADAPPPSARALLPPGASVDAVDEGLHEGLHAWHVSHLALEAAAAAGGEAAAERLAAARAALVDRATALPHPFPGHAQCAAALQRAMAAEGWDPAHVDAVRRWAAAAAPPLHVGGGA